MRTCPRCQDLNGRDANYCSGCGTHLIEFAAIPVERSTARGRNRRCVYCGECCYGIRCAVHSMLPLPA